MGAGETRDVDFTPSGFLSGGGNVIAGLEAATAALRAFFRADNPRAIAIGTRFVSVFDDDLRQAVQRSSPLNAGSLATSAFEADPHYWSRWLVGVRETSAAICDAYSLLPAGDGLYSAESRHRVARRLADSVKWNLCDRRTPDTALWSRLGALFENEVEGRENGCLAGDVEGVVREYIRALAFHSAALDQLTVAQALAVARLIQLSLPFLSVSRKPISGLHYAVSPTHAPVPSRQLRDEGNSAWHFTPAAADELLLGLERQFERGEVPRALAGAEPTLFGPALRHLRRMWSIESPQRRWRRHRTDGGLSVACGLTDCRSVLDGAVQPALKDAVVENLARHGVGACLTRSRNVHEIDPGEIVALRFADGEGWHLGLVRRLRSAEHRIHVGVELISRQARAHKADDGEASVDVILCDPLQPGEAVRVIASPGSLRSDMALYVPLAGEVRKLKPLDAVVNGRGFDLRVFQVL